MSKLNCNFGFVDGKNSTHFARTMMLSDISILMNFGGRDATYDVYRNVVVQENLLGKPSQKSRKLSWNHLSNLYSLSSKHCLFRAFRRLYFLADQGQALLSFQLAYARDPLLRVCAPFLAGLKIGQQISREDTEQFLAECYPERFTRASLKSTAQNINGTWTQAGFLKGRVKKVRRQPVVSEANVTFALFMAYLQGHQSQMMLSSQWVRLLGLPDEDVLRLASQAAQRGLMVYRRTGDVMEFHFPDFLTDQEHEWLHESS